MVQVIQNNFRIRKSFAKLDPLVDIPNLIQLQKKSYEKFLQANVVPEERENIGLQEVFKSVFPITDFNETATLEFVSYQLEKPKYMVDECRQRGMTYASPMKVVIRLVVWDKDEELGTQTIRDVKEQEVYFGEIPLMTPNGTFVINGTERVVVSQLHRSPGAFFTHDAGSTHSSGKLLYSARIIPYRGSWLDFEFDHKDILYVRIDKRRKIPATILLRALGYTAEKLLNYFYDTQTILVHSQTSFSRSMNFELLLGNRADRDIIEPNSGKVIIPKNRKFTKVSIKKIQDAGIKSFSIEEDHIYGMISSKDLVNEETGEVIVEANEAITKEKLEAIVTAGIKSFDVLYIDKLNVGPYLSDTLRIDKVNSPDEAILDIYKRLRPGDPPTPEIAEKLFYNLFFNAERYDLSQVGRLKLNYKFDLDEPLENTILTKKDILEVVKYLLDLKNGKGMIDDIDHLGNRRVRAVGELVANQFRIGLVRMERAIKERMSLQEVETLMPHDLVNAKPVSAVLKEFFGSGQLSQFMDQTNPLSEITHKRRLSALGPGGLSRERSGFEVRDVHPTHYGRICPIETPEGPNIGLIASLSTYARVNEFGFVETPYRKVENSRVTNEVEFYSALQEEKHVIAQANVSIDKSGNFTEELVSARKSGVFMMARAEDVTLMDISSNQLVSIAASLIPFLENDDANRALMGSNMQRQAVPLLKTEAPIVGTGMEKIVAKDSGVTVVARREGVVDFVDSSRIVVRATSGNETDEDVGGDVDIYRLAKYRRSNQNTCLNQKPIVSPGDHVRIGEVLADGPSTDTGELALGRNLIVAYMPWGGYNFEDSILMSERILKEDIFTSVHIEEFECIARDTKLGPEEITIDIPNVGEETLKQMDESGIVKIGAVVKPGDILVGKITPKGETQLSPEEKLLRAIFGEKAGDVKDSSLRVPTGVNGTVISVQVFSRKGVTKDDRAKLIEKEEEETLLKDRDHEIKVIVESAQNKIAKLITGKTAQYALVDEDGTILIDKGDKIPSGILEKVPFELWDSVRIGETNAEEKIARMMQNAKDKMKGVMFEFDERIERLKKGDELPPGVIKMVKVNVAIKRKLQVGDKMAGRHGNKGVISRILPEEDMPYLEDGTIVDVVLNPLGVPSRMNIGQILETYLGWAGMKIGKEFENELTHKPDSEKLRKKMREIFKHSSQTDMINKLPAKEIVKLAEKLKKGVLMATPVFDGAHEANINDIFEQYHINKPGKTILFDGRTGEAFEQDVTVGMAYILKLHHLVDDKIHARSIGPYSLVTQQPLGGKAQFGGQRLGEMEVWAMEAYGATYSLQEFLTVKSDDIVGRTRMYEAIVKGENVLESGLPESFNVLVKELQALCLNVELIHDEYAPT